LCFVRLLGTHKQCRYVQRNLAGGGEGPPKKTPARGGGGTNKCQTRLGIGGGHGDARAGGPLGTTRPREGLPLLLSGPSIFSQDPPPGLVLYGGRKGAHPGCWGGKRGPPQGFSTGFKPRFGLLGCGGPRTGLVFCGLCTDENQKKTKKKPPFGGKRKGGPQ